MASRTNLFWIFFLHQLHSCKRFEEYATRCQIENDREIKRNPQPSLEMQPLYEKFTLNVVSHVIPFIIEYVLYSFLPIQGWRLTCGCRLEWSCHGDIGEQHICIINPCTRKEQVVAGLFGETGSMWAQWGWQFSTWWLTWKTQWSSWLGWLSHVREL